MTNDHFTALSIDERNQLQLERLQSTLNRASRNVPFHKQRFKEMGIDLSDIQSLSDIARLPFLDRRQISENYPYNLFAVPLRDIVRIHTAPGITQKPTVSGYTAQDLSNWQSMMARALLAAGVTFHDILQIDLPPGLSNWGRDYKAGAEAIEASVIPNTPMSMEKKFMVLRDYKTSVLVTTPSAARHLAAYIRDKDISIHLLELRKLILVGEAIAEDDRRRLEKDLRVQINAHFGLSEVPGPAIGFECGACQGLHLHEDHFFAEIVDPVSGASLPENQPGELVLTTLTTRAFPLIRFKTGDQASLMPARPSCPCGDSLRRIAWQGVRTDDLLNVDGIKVHKKQIQRDIQALLDLPSDASGLYARERDAKKYIEVWIPVNDAIFSDEIKELEALIHRSENILSENIGIPVVIRLKENQTMDKTD